MTQSDQGPGLERPQGGYCRLESALQPSAGRSQEVAQSRGEQEPRGLREPWRLAVRARLRLRHCWLRLQYL